MTNDRYIPNRMGNNMEVSYHLLVNNKENNQENMFQQSEHLHDNIKRKLISETCNGLSSDKVERVLNLHSRTFDYSEQNSLLFNSSTNGANSSLKKSNFLRHVQATPEKILDAPDFRDDFCEFYFKFCLTRKFKILLVFHGKNLRWLIKKSALVSELEMKNAIG